MTAVSRTGIDHDDPVQRRRYRRALTASATGWGLDGFDHTMFPLALGAILATLGISVAMGGTISTISLLASAVGGMLGGAIADRFGRARTLVWVIIGFSVFTALTATAQNVEQLILWRVLEGLFFGAEWPVGVALMSEYARPERRGRTMAFLQSAYSVGWAASTTAYFAIFSLLPPEVAGRVLFLVGLLPAAFIFFVRRNVSDATTTAAIGTDKPSNTFSAIMALLRPGLARTTIVTTIFTSGSSGNSTPC